MGDFLKNLKAARYTPVAIRQRFRIEYTEAGEDLYAFFESTDDVTFYRRQLAGRVRDGGRLRIYFCGNKRSVWYHYEFAEQERKLRNTLFFVDKDLDDLTGQALPVRSRIFVTDLYAIENYLCTEATVTAALEELVFLPNEGDVYTNILKQFRDGFEDIANHLRPLFSEVILLRRQHVEVSFNDFGEGLSPCFEIMDVRPKALPNWAQTFRMRCKYESANLLPADVKAMEDVLASKPHHEWLRGKFALWFFLQFFEHLWLSLVGKPINDRKKVKKTVDLKADNIFFTMQDKHPYPKGLNEFLASNIA